MNKTVRQKDASIDNHGTSRVNFIAKLPILCLAALIAGCGPNHQNDKKLIDNFTAHEGEFEKLVLMLRTDKKLKRIDDTWTSPEDTTSVGVTRERVAEYRSMFSTLGIPRGFVASHDPEDFQFIASTAGISVSGSCKGYCYRESAPSAPDRILSDLNGYRAAHLRPFTAYRHIKGKWYLYYYEN